MGRFIEWYRSAGSFQRKLVAGLALLVVIFLGVQFSGGGSSSPTTTGGSSACQNAPGGLVASVEAGLTVSGGGTLTDAKTVVVPAGDQNTNGWPALLLAARIGGTGMDDVVGVWATDSDGGPIVAVDSFAREFSDWGAAAQEGSPMRDAMDALRFSAAYDAVSACVG